MFCILRIQRRFKQATYSQFNSLYISPNTKRLYLKRKTQFKIFQKTERVQSESNDNTNNIFYTNTRKTSYIVQKIFEQKYANENQSSRPGGESLESFRSRVGNVEWDLEALRQKRLDTGVYKSDFCDVKCSDENMEVDMDGILIDDVSDEGRDYLKRLQVGTKRKNERDNHIHDYTDRSVPVSDIPCLGCGAMLHCQDPAIPGFIIAERFRKSTKDELRDLKCRRCFLMSYYNRCLEAECPTREFNQIIKSIRISRALIIHIVDMTDFPNSFINNLPKLVGLAKQFYVIGNKIDLIPRDGTNFVARMTNALEESCEFHGISRDLLRHVCVISAKTGFGIEQLITKLMSDWGKKGSVFLVGCTNSGKSTLFNRLVSSDFCKSHVREMVHRATVSVWPGTTMGVLKFPIITPTIWRLRQRALRLADDTGSSEADWLKRFHISKANEYETLAGNVGKTDFSHANDQQGVEKLLGKSQKYPDYMAGVSSYSIHGDGSIGLDADNKHEEMRQSAGVSVHELYQRMPNTRWCHDTPGLINHKQVINHLTVEELTIALPRGILQPRTFVVSPGDVLFVSGLARLDYLQGDRAVFFTVVAPRNLPVHVVGKDEADDFYTTHIGSPTLGVPLGDSQRLDRLPSLIGRLFRVEGEGWRTTSVDLVLSSIGWTSVTAGKFVAAEIQVYTVGGEGCVMRRPSLFPGLINHRGKRQRRGVSQPAGG